MDVAGAVSRGGLTRWRPLQRKAETIGCAVVGQGADEITETVNVDPADLRAESARIVEIALN